MMAEIKSIRNTMDCLSADKLVVDRAWLATCVIFMRLSVSFCLARFVRLSGTSWRKVADEGTGGLFFFAMAWYNFLAGHACVEALLYRHICLALGSSALA